VIVTERRKPYHLVRDFTDLGLDPAAVDLTVVKIGYLEPELYALAQGWLLALTPGGVDQDLLRLGHKRIQRPLYPFDPAMTTPDLSATLLR
jgi:microcystin degradation protein MlrC